MRAKCMCLLLIKLNGNMGIYVFICSCVRTLCVCLCKQVGMCLTFCFHVKAVSCFAHVSCAAKQMTWEPIDFSSSGSVFQAAGNMLYNEELTYIHTHAHFRKKGPNAVFSPFFSELEGNIVWVLTELQDVMQIMSDKWFIVLAVNGCWCSARF